MAEEALPLEEQEELEVERSDDSSSQRSLCSCIHEFC